MNGNTRFVFFVSDSSDILLKALLIGDSGTGKSAVIVRFTEDRFSDNYVSTVGVDFKIKRMESSGQVIQLQIWDTAGQERFRSITKSYYRASNAVLVVFDVKNRESFEHVNYWLEQINREADLKVVKFLVANKCDIEDREVKKEEGEALAQQLGLKYYEVSAKDGKGIEVLFECVVKDALAVTGQSEQHVPSAMFSQGAKKEERCC